MRSDVIGRTWEIFLSPSVAEMASNKKIQISSSFDVQAESLHEVISDHNKGKSKVVDVEQPHKRTENVTVTSNPVKYEKKGIEEPQVTEGQEVKVNPATVGYDTSQL